MKIVLLQASDNRLKLTELALQGDWQKSFSESDSRDAFVHPEIETEENVRELYLTMAKILFQTLYYNLT